MIKDIKHKALTDGITMSILCLIYYQFNKPLINLHKSFMAIYHKNNQTLLAAHPSPTSGVLLIILSVGVSAPHQVAARLTESGTAILFPGDPGSRGCAQMSGGSLVHFYYFYYYYY